MHVSRFKNSWGHSSHFLLKKQRIYKIKMIKMRMSDINARINLKQSFVYVFIFAYM